jgi:hypothetical protein
LLFKIKMYHDPRSEDSKLLGEVWYSCDGLVISPK